MLKNAALWAAQHLQKNLSHNNLSKQGLFHPGALMAAKKRLTI